MYIILNIQTLSAEMYSITKKLVTFVVYGKEKKTRMEQRLKFSLHTLLYLSNFVP